MLLTAFSQIQPCIAWLAALEYPRGREFCSGRLHKEPLCSSIVRVAASPPVVAPTMSFAGPRTHLSRPWLLGVRVRRLSRGLSPRSRSLLAAGACVACLCAAVSLLDVVLFAAASSLFAARAGRAWGGSGDHRLGVSSGWLTPPRYVALVGAEVDSSTMPNPDWVAVTGGGAGGCRMRRPEAALCLSYLSRAHSFVAVGGVAGVPSILAARTAPAQTFVVGVAGGADACTPRRGSGDVGGGGAHAVACAPSASATDLLATVEGTDVAVAAGRVDRVLVMGCGALSSGGGSATAAARDELMGGLWRLLRPDSLVFYHGWSGAGASLASGDGEDGEGDGPVLPPWLAAGCYTEVAAVVATSDGWGGLLVVRPTPEFLAGRRVCAARGAGDDAVAAAAAAEGDLPTTWSATAGRFDYRAWSLQRRLATASARTVLDGIALIVLGVVVLAQRRAGLWGRVSEGRPALLGE